MDTGTYAPFHQHFIVARLDLDVDGTDNTVYCCDSEAAAIGEDNPLGLTLNLRQTPLRTEAEGQQDYRWDTQRTWKVASDTRRNRLGTPTAYKLIPGSCFPPMMDPASPVFRRAEVIGHTLWVTPYDPAERWPAGEFCNQSERDEGLAAWTKQNRPIAGADVVLWYVFRRPPHHPAGRLAGHAGRHGLVLAEAVGLLRPQPGPGRPGLVALLGGPRTVPRVALRAEGSPRQPEEGDDRRGDLERSTRDWAVISSSARWSARATAHPGGQGQAGTRRARRY